MYIFTFHGRQKAQHNDIGYNKWKNERKRRKKTKERIFFSKKAL